MDKGKPTETITALLRRIVPVKAVTMRTTRKGVEYLHATRGWKRVSWQRVGIIPYQTN